MGADSKTTVVHAAGQELFVAISGSGHAITIETDSKRNSAPSPVELLLAHLLGPEEAPTLTHGCETHRHCPAAWVTDDATPRTEIAHPPRGELVGCARAVAVSRARMSMESRRGTAAGFRLVGRRGRMGTE